MAKCRRRLLQTHSSMHLNKRLDALVLYKRHARVLCLQHLISIRWLKNRQQPRISPLDTQNDNAYLHPSHRNMCRHLRNQSGRHLSVDVSLPMYYFVHLLVINGQRLLLMLSPVNLVRLNTQKRSSPVKPFSLFLPLSNALGLVIYSFLSVYEDKWQMQVPGFSLFSAVDTFELICCCGCCCIFLFSSRFCEAFATTPVVFARIRIYFISTRLKLIQWITRAHTQVTRIWPSQ